MSAKTKRLIARVREMTRGPKLRNEKAWMGGRLSLTKIPQHAKNRKVRAAQIKSGRALRK